MAYEKQSIPPTQIKVLIDAFNVLPIDTDRFMDKIFTMANRFNSEYESAWQNEGREYAEEVHRKYLDIISEAIGPEISAAIRLPGFNNIVSEISQLIAERRIFKGLYAAFRFVGGGIEETQGLGSSDFPKTYNFTEDGRVEVTSRVIRIFQDISIERMRICKICDKFFWAKKLNAWTCSTECAGRLGNEKKLKKKDPAKYRAAIIARAKRWRL